MKKILAGWMGCVALLALATGRFRNTISEIELDIPAMRTQACAEAGGGALAKLGIGCLVYTSDAADDLPCVDPGGPRITNTQTSRYRTVP